MLHPCNLAQNKLPVVMVINLCRICICLWFSLPWVLLMFTGQVRLMSWSFKYCLFSILLSKDFLCTSCVRVIYFQFEEKHDSSQLFEILMQSLSYLHCFVPDNLCTTIHLDLKFQTSGSKQDKEGAKEGGERGRLSDDLSIGSSNTDTMYPPLDPQTKISIPRPVLLTERFVLCIMHT